MKLLLLLFASVLLLRSFCCTVAPESSFETSKKHPGLVVPYPKSPAEVIRSLSALVLLPSGVVEKVKLVGRSLLPGVPSTTAAIAAPSSNPAPSFP